MDDGDFNPWPFLIGAALGAYLFSPPRDAAADLAVLREARAIRAVSQHYGYVTPEQAQVLYRAGEIEAKVDGWRSHNDARKWRGATTALGWLVGLAVLLSLASIPGANPVAILVFAIIAGGGTFKHVEKARQELIRAPKELMGHHSHGGWGRHSHPHTRRHRHHGDLDGPMY